jgi:hypothetical protein
VTLRPQYRAALPACLALACDQIEACVRDLLGTPPRVEQPLPPLEQSCVDGERSGAVCGTSTECENAGGTAMGCCQGGRWQPYCHCVLPGQDLPPCGA